MDIQNAINKTVDNSGNFVFIAQILLTPQKQMK